MSDVLTYDPKKVVFVYGGRQITGFNEDDMITIRPNGEGMQLFVGADGEVARSIDPNHTFEIEASLSTASKSNTYLSEQYNKDRSTGSNMQPLLIKDLAGDTLFYARQAWVANFPESTRGRTVAGQNWIFHTGQIENPIVGGNN